MSIFPMYGLNKSKDLFKTQAFSSIGTELKYADKIDKTYFNKMDFCKRYTEEMLRAKDMRTEKK